MRAGAGSKRTLLDVCGVAHFCGVEGCTLLDVCGRSRALDIYIHLYIYILIEQIVVVMAGDDGDEQRTERSERTEQKGFATVDVMRLRHTEHTRTRSHPHSSSS